MWVSIGFIIHKTHTYVDANIYTYLNHSTFIEVNKYSRELHLQYHYENCNII